MVGTYKQDLNVNSSNVRSTPNTIFKDDELSYGKKMICDNV